MLYPRHLKEKILQASGDTPVILINGARQTGKSTLVKELFAGPKNSYPYFSFDNLAILDSARSDPQGFVESLPERVILDEIQRAPEVMLPIKYSVDQNRQPGRFILTGSADVLALPKIADTLVGRIEIHSLWPLSQGELRGVRESFVDTAFGDGLIAVETPVDFDDLVNILVTGGYPDVVQRESFERRQDWFASYITTLIEREVRELRNVEQLTVMPKLLKLVASRSGNLLNNADLARSLEIGQTTLKTYLSLLQLLFVFVPISPWFSNRGKRLIKSSKIHLNDSGLLCHFLGCDAQALLADPGLMGAVFENFVMMELVKQLSWSRVRPKLYHLRTEAGHEVDIVLEAPDGRIVGIECKSGKRVGSDTLKGLKSLREIAGKKFHRGFVLYLGNHTLTFEQHFQAIPVSAVWGTNR